MNCIDAYLSDHPGVSGYYAIKTHNKLPGGCPGNYGYLDNPSWCNTDGTKCYLCWLREIPETENKEKENENMPVDGKTDIDDILPTGKPVMEFGVVDYKQKYEDAMTEILNLNAIIEEKNQHIHDILVEHDAKDKERESRFRATRVNLHAARDRIKHLEMVIRAIEAITGKKILEDF